MLRVSAVETNFSCHRLEGKLGLERVQCELQTSNSLPTCSWHRNSWKRSVTKASHARTFAQPHPKAASMHCQRSIIQKVLAIRMPYSSSRHAATPRNPPVWRKKCPPLRHGSCTCTGTRHSRPVREWISLTCRLASTAQLVLAEDKVGAMPGRAIRPLGALNVAFFGP